MNEVETPLPTAISCEVLAAPAEEPALRRTPPPREFLFIRHAQSEANCGKSDHCDCDLTEDGRTHARLVAFGLRRAFDLRGFRGVASPYRRARETAKRISDFAAIPFEVDPRVREWGKDCVIDEKPYPEEKLVDAAIRLDSFVKLVAPGRKLIVVSHATPIFLMIQLLKHGNVAKALSQCVGDFWAAIANCGLSHVRGNEVVCVSRKIA